MTSKLAKLAFGFALATVVIFFAILVYIVAADCFSGTRGENALEAGIALADANKFPAAIRKLDAALREKLTRERRACAFGERGWCYTEMGRDSDALPDFNAALALDSSLTFALLDRGLVFHRQARFDQAMNDYTRAIELDPNNLDAYRNRALIFAQRAQFQEAIADMNEAIRCAPNDPRWYVRRASFYFAAQELQPALASFDSAIRLDPENVQGQYGRAQVLALRGDIAHALMELDREIRKRPASASLFFVRALIYYDTKELKLAVEDCSKAIELRKDFAAPYATRAALEFELGYSDSALAFARLATQLDPRMPLPFQLRGRVLDARHDFPAAIFEFDRAVALDSGYAVARAWSALAKAHSGAYAVARREFDEITRAFPADAEGHRLSAWFLATCPAAAFRDGPLAVEQARLALRYSHEDAGALDVLALAFAEEGDFAQAIALEEKALDKIPNNGFECRRLSNHLTELRRGIPYRDNVDP